MCRQMIRMGTLNSASTIAAGGTETNTSIRCQSVNCERVKSKDPLAHSARHRILFGDGHVRYWKTRLPLTVSGCVCVGYLSFMFPDQMQRTIPKASTSMSMAKVIERLRWLHRVWACASTASFNSIANDCCNAFDIVCIIDFQFCLYNMDTFFARHLWQYRICNGTCVCALLALRFNRIRALFYVSYY